jgi:dihydrolipoamide dehydrogenase
MAETFDLVVIGSGPGGYVGAIRAAQLGLSTAVVEKDPTFGGTCLNVGCIPSKALLDSSEHFMQANHELADHGVKVSKVELDLGTMLKRKDKIVSDLTGGIKYLFDKNKIKTFAGYGRLKSANEVEVKNEKGDVEVVQARNIMIATGSVPNGLPGIDFDGKYVVSSTEALDFKSVPKEMVVIGAGAIGLEMGSVWMRLGAKVTVIEFAKKIAGGMDTDMSKRMLQILKKQGMNFVLEAKVTKTDADSKTVTYESLKDGSTQTLPADVVLVAAGRKPFTEGLGLEEMGIDKNERGFIQVNEHWQTKYQNIFAIGDVIPGPMLAHKAEEEGVAVAELIAGHAGHVNYETVPGVIYTWPEMASVGATEDQLKADGVPYNKGTFPFTPNGRAKAMGATDGQVKILAHKDTDRVLGVHIVGPWASDLLAEAVLCMEFEGTSEDIARSFHSHPTLTEVMREAALAVDKRARQM